MEELTDNNSQNNITQLKSVESSDADEESSKDGTNPPPPPPADTRICLVGGACSDPAVLQAAQGFGIPVVTSENGEEWQNTESPSTIFVLDEFSGPVFENLHRVGHRLLGTTAVKELSQRNEPLPNNSRPLYSLAMWGLVICFTGFRKKDELARLIQLIHNMGGSIRKDMVSKVTHLVAHKCGGDKYQYALTFRVPVMAASWVHNAWAMRAQIGFSAADPNNNAEHKLKPFQGARVCFHGFPDEEQRHMTEVLIENGGTHTDIDDPACSHLVLDSAVTYDLIKAGAMLPKCRLSICLPQDVYKLPTTDRIHISDLEIDNKTITDNKDFSQNENVKDTFQLKTPERIISDTTLTDECFPVSFKRKLVTHFSSSMPEEKSLMEIDEIQECNVESSTPKVRNNNTELSFNGKHKSFDSLPPIKEISPMVTLNDESTCDQFCAKKELTFSDKDSTFSPAPPTAKRRKTMSPNEAFSRKYKKSPKESFKTLSSIRRSLRLKTMNSLTKWISSNDVSGKVSSPVPGTLKRFSKHFNNSSETLLPTQANPSPKKSLLVDDLHKTSSPRSWSSAAVEEDNTHRMPLVVDESTVTSVPAQAPTQAYIVKAEWFWASVQNEGCVDEKDYLFEDYLESLVSPSRRGTQTGTPVTVSGRGARKRKRFQDAVSRVLSGGNVNTTLSPAVSKRRSSVSDAGLLSVSGSFLDCTPSPGSQLSDEVESVNSETSRKSLSPRHQVFLELVQTESNYVNILNTIMTLFKTPLEEMCETDGQLLNPTELKIIFGHLPPIYQTHCQMLEQLKWAASHWTEDVSIGNIFLKFSSDLVKAYPPFVNFFENTREMLLKCDQSKPRFHAFLKIGQTKPECGRQSLHELLIRPVQRLPSISLLLNDILKHTTKSNPDHSALEQAISSIREVMTHINEDKRKTEGQMAMFDIFNEIDNCPPHLVSSHRSFITRCDVTELSDSLSGRGDSLSLFLFSDIVEVCKKRSKCFNSLKSPNTAGGTTKISNSKPYKHIRLMPLSHVKRVIDIKETEECHNVFALMCKSNQELKEKLYYFTITDEEIDKMSFLKTLCRQMANTICRADAENFLASLDPQQLDIETSDVGLGTLGKAFKFASRTRMKVGRAFSFNKTPSKLKRAMSTMMSPFGSTSNLTPASQLAQMRLASCNNLNELGNGSSPPTQPTGQQYVAPMSVQPTRRNKHASLSVASLRRL